MTYVITGPCTGVKDKACAGECPVDCIYEGQRMLYTHSGECVDCSACEPVCPVEAIVCEDDVPGRGPSSPARTRSSSTSSAPPAAPPRPARCPTTPTTSLATSPAGNATCPCVRYRIVAASAVARCPAARQSGPPPLGVGDRHAVPAGSSTSPTLALASAQKNVS